jgi:hypothetical protein
MTGLQNMDDRQVEASAVFVVTIRPAADSPEQLCGSVMPVTASGSGDQPKRWFRALDQLPGILRNLLASLGHGQLR